MTCRERLESYLHQQRVPFGVHPHASAYTAHELATAEHLSEQLVAKVVVVAADESFALLVMPAARRLDLELAAEVLKVRHVRLASEGELARLFPDCELGAMPPFGTLYGLPVYVDRTLEANGTIFFPDGTHTTAMSVGYSDFRRLAEPTVAAFTTPYHAAAPLAPLPEAAAPAAAPSPAAPAAAPSPAAPAPILVPLDGSAFGEHALPMALALARLGGRGISLAHAHTLITPVITPLGAEIVSSRLDVELREQEASYLQDVTRRLRAVWDGPIDQVILDAPVAAAIGRHAGDSGAGLIVLSTHGRGGIERAWLGSVADQLVRHAPVPVMAVRPAEGEPDFAQLPPLRNVLIPLDGSPLAEEAIELVAQLGLPAQTRYTLLHVVSPPLHSRIIGEPEPAVDVDVAAQAWDQAATYLSSVAERMQQRNMAAIQELRLGAAAPTILEAVAANAIDLIVMTTHGRGGVVRMLVGSVADKVLRGASVPLLVCRPQPGQGAEQPA